MVCMVHLPDDTNWGRIWRSAINAGLLRLPPYPQRDSSDFVITDGFSAVFEVAEAGRYLIAGAENPDSYSSADDKLFLAVLAVFRPYIREPFCRWRKP
jgi:hypothetical protein